MTARSITKCADPDVTECTLARCLMAGTCMADSYKDSLRRILDRMAREDPAAQSQDGNAS